eukprot:m.62837 g.62837  ORF g.62837 m.62837 type:complete len:288 (-) comp9631_c0_seq2:3789-4652(-)
MGSSTPLPPPMVRRRSSAAMALGALCISAQSVQAQTTTATSPSPSPSLLRVSYVGEIAGLSPSDTALFGAAVTNSVVAASSGTITSGDVTDVTLSSGSIIATVFLDAAISEATAAIVAQSLRRGAPNVTLPATSGGSTPRSFDFTTATSGLVFSAAPTPAPPPPPTVDGGATRNPQLNEIPAATKNLVIFACFATVFVTVVAYVAWSQGVGCGTDPLWAQWEREQQKKKFDEKGADLVVEHDNWIESEAITITFFDADTYAAQQTSPWDEPSPCGEPSPWDEPNCAL